MRRTKFPKNNQYQPDIAPIKEAQFINEYMVDFDPEKAAIRTGVINEYTAHKDRKAAIRNIFTKVRDQLRSVIEDRTSRLGITCDRVILELSNIAFQDPSSLFDEYGSVKNIHDLPENVRKSISEIEFGVSREHGPYTKKIKLYDKMSALQTMLKQLGHLGPDVQVNQYNQTNNYTQNNFNTNLHLDDFSNEELQVMRKMIGDQEPEELLELQSIEQEHQQYA
jgi:hypothetical protein